MFATQNTQIYVNYILHHSDCLSFPPVSGLNALTRFTILMCSCGFLRMLVRSDMLVQVEDRMRL